jgi:enoyl-CoA hydratase/carnithine racemase
MLKTVGADPKNEVLILTGSGDDFMMKIDPEGFALEHQDLRRWAYEYAYKDGRTNVSALINDLEIPTIGVLNGSGAHAEICLMCDLTLCAEEAVIFDPHFAMGSVPGDGIHSCLIELLGVKRAAYALITGRAFALADHIMRQPRVTRRLTTQIIRRPWKKRITDDLDGGFGIQMFAHLAKNEAIHDGARAQAAAEATNQVLPRS